MRGVALHERSQNKKSYRQIQIDTAIPYSTVRDWCNEYSNDPDMCKRRRHDPVFDEHRGRPLLISDAQVREMELICERVLLVPNPAINIGH